MFFVGRVVPHKRPDDLIRSVALARAGGVDAHLRLVGEPLSDAFGASVASLASSLLPGAHTIERGLSVDELGDRYRSASVFLCMSEHEGFCVPIAEAFALRIPVVARGVAAIPETVGDAGVLLAGDDDALVAAEALALVAGDPALAADLAARGLARAAEFAPAHAEAALRAALEQTVAA